MIKNKVKVKELKELNFHTGFLRSDGQISIEIFSEEITFIYILIKNFFFKNV